MSFPRLRRERLSAVVQKVIRDHIIESRLKAGDHIPTEMTLAEALELRYVLESTYVDRSVDHYTEQDICEMHALLDLATNLIRWAKRSNVIVNVYAINL